LADGTDTQRRPDPEEAPIALATLARDGTVLATNAAWRELTGRSDGRLHDVVSRGGRLFLETHCLPVLLSGQEVHEVAIDVERPGGERLPVLLHGRPGAGALHLALAPAGGRRVQQEELRRMRSRERRANDLQALVARLGDLALGGAEPAGLAQVAAQGLADLLPADLVTILEVPGAGEVTGGLAAAPLLPDAPPAAEVDAELRFAEVLGTGRPVDVVSGAPTGLGVLLDAEALTALRIAVGPEGRPYAVLAVHRRSDERPTAFEIGAVQAVARTLWTAVLRFRDVREAEHRALHDPLTGLANRRALLVGLEAALERAVRHERPGPVVLFLDLDGFKAVNDAHGHHAGDDLLRAVADRLRESTREGDVVARMGGDEFVVLCPDAAPGVPVERLADRLAGALDAPLQADGRVVRLRASVGGVRATPGADAEDVLRLADAAMYRAKAGGRDGRPAGEVADGCR
jgi:diguanylate cyclase (GGDEF)-like protein